MRSSTSSPGDWSTAHSAGSTLSALTKSNTRKGHKYLTLVYQIDIGITRRLWVGKERTIESFQGFFTAMGQEVISKICFICSDMWGTLPEAHPRKMLRGFAYPRSLPHRLQYEQSSRQGSR